LYKTIFLTKLDVILSNFISDLNMTAQEMEYDRETYILVYSYLDTNRHILFRKLFPQYIKSLIKLDKITSNLVKNIVLYNRSNICIESDAFTSKIQVYTKILHDSLNNQYNIKSNDKNLIKFITSYLLTHRWIDMYYNLFTLLQ
jgi:hypothetical protein